MNEVKMWAVDGTGALPVQSASQIDSERLLEDTLATNPDMLLDGLTLVGRQTSTESGPLDLLGIDSEGRLVVFELKRGTLSREAVAQVIDYASFLDRLDVSDLANYIADKSGQHGIDRIDGFEEWYLETSGAESLDSLKPVRMFLVGLGADDTTERMVKFLANNSGMHISLLTFYGFAHEGKTLLARHVRVEGTPEVERRPKRRRLSQRERWERFDRRVEDFGARQLIDAVRNMFRENWPESRERIGANGIRIQLLEAQHRQYARIDAWSNGVSGLIFFPEAKALCLDAFRQPVEEIPFQTWPRDRDPLRDHRSEIQFRLTAEVWERNKEELASLVQAVYAAWEGGLNEQR